MRSIRRGFSLIELIVVLAILSILISLTLAGVQRVRRAAARTSCANNLRQIAIASHHYHDVKHVLPPGHSRDIDGGRFPMMGWGVRILPYIGEGAAWEEAVQAFAISNHFYSDPPHRGLGRPMPIFSCPSDGRVSQRPVKFLAAMSSYLGVGGDRVRGHEGAFKWNGLLYLDSRVSLEAVRDGTSHTLMFGERPPSPEDRFGWWYGGLGQRNDGSCDTFMNVNEINEKYPFFLCIKWGPFSYQEGSIHDYCDAFHYWSLHGGGANFAFADGSVRFLAYSADSILPALATRNGGEAVLVPD